MNKYDNYSFEDLAKLESGTVLEDAVFEKVRYLIMRGPCSLTAYLGVPLGCAYAGQKYDDIPIEVHGGFTFAEYGKDGTSWSEGYYWIGWDYAHAWDAVFYNTIYSYRNIRYTLPMVRDDVLDIISQFGEEILAK